MNRESLERRVDVKLPRGGHPIRIGAGLLDRLGPLLRELFSGSRVVVVTDSNVGPRYLPRVQDSLTQAGFDVSEITVPAGEASKNLSQTQRLYEAFTEFGLERRSPVLALGGGVVGDLAGFAAATYLRGVPFVQVGTSVIAQVDSSIGGKVGVNLPQGKNLVGAFHQPDLVVSDVSTLHSLPDSEYRAGLAEVVKYGVIRDASLLEFLSERLGEVRSRDENTLLEIVEISSRIKAEVVENDEREAGLRAILNFGHTVGHALETIRGYGTLRHGEAVAIGMVAATRIAIDRGLCDSKMGEDLEQLLLALGLPVKAPFPADPADLMRLLARDKKVRDGQIVLILPTRPGEVQILDNTSEEKIESILPSIVSSA